MPPAHDQTLTRAMARMNLAHPDRPLVARAAAQTVAADLRTWIDGASTDEQLEARRLAAAKIERSLQDGSAHIDLTARSLFGVDHGGAALDALPPCLSSFENAQLTIDPQTLSAAADSIADLRGVVALTCRGATSLPRRWPPGIERLCLDDSPNIDLSNGFQPHGRLAELSLQRCGLEALPDLSALAFLRSLHLADNKLASLPDSISSQRRLQVLGLKNNQLQTMPANEGLKVLDLRDNPMHTEPAFLEAMTGVHVLIRGDAKTTAWTRFQVPATQLGDDELRAAVGDLDRAIAVLRAEWHGTTAPHGNPRWRRVEDTVFLPALVQAENHLTPGLGLKYAGSTQSLCSELWDLTAAAMNAGANRTARILAHTMRNTDAAPLDEASHPVALHAMAVPTLNGLKLSIVVIDSVAAENATAMAGRVTQLLRPHGIETYWGIQPLEVQKIDFGCPIFTLSFAKKMRDTYASLRNLHRGNLSPGRDIETTPMQPAFYKHANARSTLRRVFEETGIDIGAQVVNKQGQTLDERTAAGRRTRQHPERGELTYNASIEAKRIQFFERAAWMYQDIARQRGLSLAPGVTPRTEVPTSSVLPLLRELRERTDTDPVPQREEGGP